MPWGIERGPLSASVCVVGAAIAPSIMWTYYQRTEWNDFETKYEEFFVIIVFKSSETSFLCKLVENQINIK